MVENLWNTDRVTALFVGCLSIKIGTVTGDFVKVVVFMEDRVTVDQRFVLIKRRSRFKLMVFEISVTI